MGICVRRRPAYAAVADASPARSMSSTRSARIATMARISGHKRKGGLPEYGPKWRPMPDPMATIPASQRPAPIVAKAINSGLDPPILVHQRARGILAIGAILTWGREQGSEGIMRVWLGTERSDHHELGEHT